MLMTKYELISEMSRLSGLTKADAERALEAYLQAVETALKNGEEVKLIGFGSFITTRKEATIGRNPKTGETMNIPARTVPKFRPGKQLKEAIGK
ncbi:MAG: HU family DNA-binding protein [Holosporales bacterium]|jgi:DNA-binding protein HU-beta|nr:HU family DNA-binding protein [Holosporales bacterium]